MPETYKEWVTKANADYRVAKRELSVVDEPAYDSVVFHSQQCIEKLLKAVLVANGVRPPKTHDLSELSRCLQVVDLTWKVEDRDLRWLSKGATDFRYPGDSADYDEARASFNICEGLRENLIQRLQGVDNRLV